MSDPSSFMRAVMVQYGLVQYGLVQHMFGLNKIPRLWVPNRINAGYTVSVNAVLHNN